jgi:transcriptional regulator with GAF, ATPase, and Fis domain/serine/threonine protein kinase/tetratricopeptide (TPR) repeat protein
METIGNRYEILRELGRGSMGRALLTRDLFAPTVPTMADPAESHETDSGHVVIKLLDNVALRDRFVEEFRLLRKLAHPAFVQAHELNLNEAGCLYQTLEYCHGTPMQPGSLQDASLLPSVASSLLGAIDHLHRLGLVHGDLAPANLLLSVHSPSLVKVLDLGTSGKSGSGAGSTSGILAYAAPERLEGHPLTVASDLWSLGAVLFGLVHRCHPFPDYPAQTDALTTPCRKGLEPHLWDPWLDRLLAQDPEDRFASVAAALANLQSLMGEGAEPVATKISELALSHLPFVDIDGQLAVLTGRIRSAIDSGTPICIKISGPHYSGRSRLLTEVCHRISSHDVQTYRESVLPTDGEGDVLRRLLTRLGHHQGGEPFPGSPMGCARALLSCVRSAPAAVLISCDDVELADPKTQQAFEIIERACTENSNRAGRLSLLMGRKDSGEDTDVQLRHWTQDDLKILMQAMFPERRIAQRIIDRLTTASRGLPGILHEVLKTLAVESRIEVNSAAVQLSEGPTVEGHVPSTNRATIETAFARLEPESQREASLIAYARGPVPIPLVSLAASQLRETGLVASMVTPDGPAVTLVSETLAELARQHVESTDAYRIWTERWSESSEDAARGLVESLWYRLQSDDSAVHEEARLALRTLTPEQGSQIVSNLLVEGWPDNPQDALLVAKCLEARHDSDDAIRYYTDALSGAGGNSETTCAEAAVRLGELQARLARHPEAIAAFQIVLQSGEELLNSSFGASAFAGLACSAVMNGQLDEAEEWSRKGRQSIGDDDHLLQSRIQYAQGLVHWYRGNFADAKHALQQAHEHAQTSDDIKQEAAVVTAMGLVAHRQGDLDAAHTHYMEALKLGEEGGDDSRVLTALQNLGVVHHEQGSFVEALDTYEEALELASALDQTGRILQITQNLGNLWRYLGVLDKARQTLRSGIEIARSTSNHYMEGILLTVLGEVAADEESWLEAEELLNRSVTMTLATQSATEESEARLALGRLYIERQEHARALKCATNALDVVARAENPALGPQLLTLKATAQRQGIHGNKETAASLIQEALDQVQLVTNPDARWPIFLEAFHDAIRRGDTDGAQTYATQVSSLIRTLSDSVPAAYQQSFRLQRRRHQAWVATQAYSTNTSQSALAPEPSGKATDELWVRLVEINRRLLAERKVQTLLEYIMDSAIHLSGAERGFLLLADPRASDAVSVKVARNIDQENIRKTRFKISRGIALRVIETGEPTITVDAMEDERYRQQLSVHDLKLRSVLCLPMRNHNEVLGAIYLDNRFRASVFRSEDLGVMEAFSDQAALALTNATLLEEMTETQAALERSRGEVETLNGKLLDQLAERERELADTHRVVVRQQEQLGVRHRYERIIGESGALRRIFHLLDRLLDNDISVLIEGESGTGKELVARAVHFNGIRKRGPFVAINCGAIPNNLVESELFGHVRGAFTGANSDKQGLFEAADGGTLLLDELGELPLEMQVKLLRAIQTGDIKKVGAAEEKHVDVRIIAATNRKLDEEVSAGRFREDLYYRLAVISIRLPPLRERREDIALLIQHFIAENQKASIGDIKAISKKALSLLTRYSWPGNVRQLEMVLKNASLFADGGTLQPEHFDSFPDIMGNTGSQLGAGQLSGRTLNDIEREAVIQALKDTQGNKKRAAEQLGIDRRTLYNKLEAYRIVVERELKVR